MQLPNDIHSPTLTTCLADESPSSLSHSSRGLASHGPEGASKRLNSPNRQQQSDDDIGDGFGGGLLIRPGSKGAAIPSRMWVRQPGDPNEREEEQLDPFAIAVLEMEVFLKAAASVDGREHSPILIDDLSVNPLPAAKGDLTGGSVKTKSGKSSAARASIIHPAEGQNAGGRALAANMSSRGRFATASGEHDTRRAIKLCAQSPRSREEVDADAQEVQPTDESENGKAEQEAVSHIVDGESLPGSPGRKAREQTAKTDLAIRRPSVQRSHSSPTMVPALNSSADPSPPVPAKPARFSSDAIVYSPRFAGPVPQAPPRRSPAAEYAASLWSFNLRPPAFNSPDAAVAEAAEHARWSPALHSTASSGSCGSPRGAVAVDWREPRGLGSYIPVNIS